MISDDLDVAARSYYKELKDPFRFIAWISYILLVVYFFALIMGYRFELALNTIFFTTLISAWAVYLLLPRKCITCRQGTIKKFVKVSPIPNHRNNLHKLFFCCDKCRTKMGTHLAKYGQ